MRTKDPSGLFNERGHKLGIRDENSLEFNSVNRVSQESPRSFSPTTGVSVFTTGCNRCLDPHL